MGRLRFGLIVGLATGYILGARAGRERYEQIARVARRVQSSPTYSRVSSKVNAAVGLGFERGRYAAVEGMHRATGAVKRRNLA